MQLLLSAAAFAARAHRDQRRRNWTREPYINHPLAVAEALATIGGVTDESTLAAALLHDVVEDTAVTNTDIESVFGQTVARIVREVTDDPHQPRAQRKQRQVDQAESMSSPARLVKLADQLCNITDLIQGAPEDWDRLQVEGYIIWAERVVRAHSGVNDALSTEFEKSAANARHQHGFPA